MKSRYKERIKKRRNFLPAVFLSLFLLLIWIIIFYFVPPAGTLTPSLFLIVTFLIVLTTTSLIFANSRRGLVIAIAAISFMLLNYFKIGNFLNLIFLVGILICTEFYLSKRN